MANSKDFKRMCGMKLDETQRNILNISKNSIVQLTVYGETKAYIPIKEPDGSWDMRYSESGTYGLSCIDLNELKAYLLVDYATGIITDARIVR